MDNLECIILCSGKCGSASLEKTMKNNNYRVIRTHGKEDFIGQFKYDGLINSINLSSNNKNLYLIDSYRTPIERKISSFFQNINIHIPNYKSKSVEELINIFNTKYINNLEEYHSINDILDEYNVEHFKNFDFQKGYVIKKKDNLIFIKLLFKDIQNWDGILSEIFGKKINIYKDNLSTNKRYHNIYQQFKRKYKVPKTYIDNILKNDKEFKIYNTEKEQELYINNWLKSEMRVNSLPPQHPKQMYGVRRMPMVWNRRRRHRSMKGAV